MERSLDRGRRDKMNRRGFFSRLGFGAAATSVALLPKVEAKELSGDRVAYLDMELPRSLMPMWVSMSVPCNFAECSFLDALTLLEPGAAKNPLELIVGYCDLIRAREVREKVGKHLLLNITVNSNPRWQDWRWVLRSAERFVYSPGA